MPSQALIHLNNQPIGPVTPYTRPGTPVETSNTMKVCKGMEVAADSHCALTMEQCAMLLGTPSPITPGKGIIYWNLQ